MYLPVHDGPGIEYRWEARFTAPVQAGPRDHLASYTKDTGSFPGAKRPGRGVDHPPPFSAEVKERVEQSRAIPPLPLCAFKACSWVNFIHLFMSRDTVILVSTEHLKKPDQIMHIFRITETLRTFIKFLRN